MRLRIQRRRLPVDSGLPAKAKRVGPRAPTRRAAPSSRQVATKIGAARILGRRTRCVNRPDFGLSPKCHRTLEARVERSPQGFVIEPPGFELAIGVNARDAEIRRATAHRALRFPRPLGWVQIMGTSTDKPILILLVGIAGAVASRTGERQTRLPSPKGFVDPAAVVTQSFDQPTEIQQARGRLVESSAASG